MGINKKAFIIIAVVIIALAVIVFLVSFKKFPGTLRPASQTQHPVEENLMDGTKAYELALIEANKWHDDATLAYLKADDVGQVRGRSSTWTAIFTSTQAKKGTGYQVTVRDLGVTEAKEVPYAQSTQTAPLPEDIITQAQAVTQVRAIPGYSNVEIISVDLIYGAGDKKWYWGVETSRGTVSVEAKKQ